MFEFAVLVIFLFGPTIVLWKVAEAKNASYAYALWGLLGWIGLIIGLALLLPKSGDQPDPTGRWN